MTPDQRDEAKGGRSSFPWWIVAAAFLLTCIYLPSLRARFDFIDDGNLVYSEGPMPLPNHLARIREKTEANYQHLGPFRPVLWIHWTIFAEINRGSDFAWRLTRLLWCVMAAGMLLWLLRELGISPLASIFAAAVAIWNPYRNEIWTSNTLAEGVAMPYALLALIAARRAARSRHSWCWDICGMLCVLAALGCKNTFAALIPAQMFLRFAIAGHSLRENWKRHGRRAAMLTLTAIAPIVHYVYFKMNWHPGQYVTNGPSFAQFRRLLSAYRGAMSLHILGAGLALVCILLLLAVRSKAEEGRSRSAIHQLVSQLWASHRAALGTAILLIGAGIAAYLPMDTISGRYVMPGVWGLDILVGVLLTRFAFVPTTTPKKTAWVALGVGLFAVACSNVGKQEKLMARTQMLWEALEWVERNVPNDSHIAWCGGADPRTALDVEEGIHFAWHLEARKRVSVRMSLFDDKGTLVHRPETQPIDSSNPIDLWIVGPSQMHHNPISFEERHFVSYYWIGRRKHECAIERPASSPLADGRTASVPRP